MLLHLGLLLHLDQLLHLCLLGGLAGETGRESAVEKANQFLL